MDVVESVVCRCRRDQLPCESHRVQAKAAFDHPTPAGTGGWSDGPPALRHVAVLVFSATALLLAAIGIYGVMAYSVRQRTSEIGVRIALGAGSGDVLGLIFRQGGRLLALGLAGGIAGALLLTRFLSTLLFGVSGHDPLTFAAIAALLTVTAALTCLLPARRAIAVDPMTALRSE
jgi:ABC-type antimicrobial peptide transport system permease subunit